MKASLWLAAHKLMRCTTCAPPVDKLIMRECEEGDNNNAIMVNKDMICGLTPKNQLQYAFEARWIRLQKYAEVNSHNVTICTNG